MLPAVQTQEPRAKHQAPESLRGKNAPPAKNRGRLDVVADVLKACVRPSTKNSVLIRANVNSVTATYLLAQLSDSRLIDTVVDEEGRVTYIATKQGAMFVDSYKNLVTMLAKELVPETRASRDETEIFA